MSYHKFLYDEDQVKEFHSLLSPLKEHEAYFLSLSARNKYLTEEERRHYELGRTEMFARKLVKQPDFDVFLRTLKSLQVSYGGYTSRTGVPLPDKCLVVYANVNPSDGKKALKQFYEKSTQLLFDSMNRTNVEKKFSSLDTELMNCYQRSRGTRTLLDVDFDVPKDGTDLVKEVVSDFASHGVEYKVLETKSGFHVLVHKDTLRYNYTEVVKYAHGEAEKRYGHAEVVVNKNEMVPVSGCLQAGFPVKFVDM